MNIKLEITMVFLLAGCYSSCTYNKVVPVCDAQTLDTVSFSRHIIPILTSNCSLSGCHSGTQPKGNLNLEASVAYGMLTDPRRGYVDTLDPEGSLLYSALISKSDPMPPFGMDDCNKKKILKWMQQKAKNN